MLLTRITYVLPLALPAHLPACLPVALLLQVQRTSHMFVTGPNVVKTVTGETVTQEVLGGAGTHTSVSGVAHGSFQNDVEALRGLRELYSYLPLNNTEGTPYVPTDDDRHRSEESLRYIVPDDPNIPYDIKQGELMCLPDMSWTCFAAADDDEDDDVLI